MTARRILVVAWREYLSRVKTKAFWIGTLALPLLMIALLILPALFVETSSVSLDLVVVDETGLLGEQVAADLGSREEADGRRATFDVEIQEPGPDREAQREELSLRITRGELDAWLWIPADVLDRGQVDYHAESVSNFITQQVLRRVLTDVVQQARFTRAGYDSDRIREMLSGVHLRTMRITEEGSRAESAEVGFILAYFLGLLLYMLLVLYGQQVLNGVLEEKTSRVVEVLLSTLSPFQLMMGKLLGIGWVGLTQVTVWLAAGLALTSPALLAAVVALPDGLPIPQISLWTLINFFIFFLLGYFIYCTFYAAIGAAFNNVQEAQQFSMVAIAFLIVPLVLMPVIINDPGGALAVVLSFIPPFTPVLMMLRISLKAPPLWQVVLSWVLCGAFAVFMVWMAGRIYRVGILMYGKKPSPREIYRWLRHA